MAQIRLLGAQIADAAIVRYATQHPTSIKADVPPPIKWAAGILAALFTFGIGAMAVWLVTSVSSMQVTLARMDERQQLQADGQGTRFADLERRVTNLEAKDGAEK